MLRLSAVVAGVVAGSLYSLIAVSITLMYRSTGVLSFAHAAFAMLASYVYTDLATTHGMPVGAAAAIAMSLTVLYGLAVERFAMRPVSDASATMKLIATLGVLSSTSGLMLLIYGFRPSAAPFLFPDGTIDIGSVAISLQEAGIFVIAGVTAAGLGTFLYRSNFGTAVRAVAQNREMALLLGVSTSRVSQFNWMLGALLAGMAGVLVSPLLLVQAPVFSLVLLKALTASLFGGLVSLPLTFVGGLTVGAVESLVRIEWSAPGSRELAILVLVLVLLFTRTTWGSVDAGGDVFASVSVSHRAAAFERFLARLRELARPALVVALPAATVLVVVIPARSEFWGFVGAKSLFFVIQALSLVILVGWAGQVSLMHGAYVGIGSFMTGYLATTEGWPIEIAVPVAAMAGMVLGALAGLPALRLKGLQFAIASLAFAGAASEWLFRQQRFSTPTSLTIPRGEVFGIDLFDTGNLYLIMLPLTAVLFVIARNLRRSTFGSLLLAARDDPSIVAQFGGSPETVLMRAFLLASFFAGLGGSLYGVLLTSYRVQDFGLGLSTSLLVFAVVGGVQSLAGPILVGLVFGLLPEVLQSSTGTEASAWPDVTAGLLVVALVVLRPSGLASLFSPSERSGDSSPATERGWATASRFELALSATAVNGASSVDDEVEHDDRDPVVVGARRAQYLRERQ